MAYRRARDRTGGVPGLLDRQHGKGDGRSLDRTPQDRGVSRVRPMRESLCCPEPVLGIAGHRVMDTMPPLFWLLMWLLLLLFVLKSWFDGESQ